MSIASSRGLAAAASSPQPSTLQRALPDGVAGATEAGHARSIHALLAVSARTGGVVSVLLAALAAGCGEDDAEPPAAGGGSGGGANQAGAAGEPSVTELPGTFSKELLTNPIPEPMGLALVPGGDALITERRGRIALYDVSAGRTRIVARIPTYASWEDGLQGIALDPDDPTWVYLYYSPRLETPNQDAPDDVSDASELEPYRGHNRLSRFRFDGEDLDVDSEQVILEVPTDRGTCCHVGGQIDFDGEGNLYLSVGDNTDPFSSDGFTPIDERPTRAPHFDAQRSSGNTNDLRGKLLRIRVQEDGSYTIPEGNLFAPDTEGTRPEIYLMGLRNPFRFSVDDEGTVYLADYAPDAAAANPDRGPAGTGKWLVAREAGNYGWPYCATAELPYVDYNFETNASGEPFDCGAPINDSPRNTGLRELPPVQQPEVFYSYGPSNFPALNAGGIGPMGGPQYRFSTDLDSEVKWPEEYDGRVVFYEWVRGALFTTRMDDEGEFEALERLPGGLDFFGPIDMEFGEDGALYLLEYGENYYQPSQEARLSRIEYRLAE